MTSNGNAGWRLTVQPRQWQCEALKSWERAGFRGVVSVVTGAGKTVFAELCIVAFRNHYTDARIVIVVPTLALMDQWYVSLREDLGVSDDQIATYSGDGRSPNPRIINLLVLNTAREIAPHLSGTGAFLIVDEVHRAASPMNSLALLGEWQGTLGMSATPEREYDRAFEEEVVPAIGDIIYKYDYLRAVQDGVISRFEFVNVKVDMLVEEQEVYDAMSRKIPPLLRRLRAGEDVEGTLKRLLQQRSAISSRAVMRIPVALRLVEQHRGTRILVFHERISAAEQLLKGFEARAVNATIYHSQISPVLRRDNLGLFRRGVFDVLVTCRALDEGVNVPETAVAVIASSTASVRQRIQRLGRVLRPAPGKEIATVYTLYATEVERKRLVAEEESDIGAETVSWMRAGIPSHD